MAATTNSSSNENNTGSRMSTEPPVSDRGDDLTRHETAASSTGSSHEAQSTSPRAANSSNGDVDKFKRKRQPRNSACQSCAALKMKCIATATPGLCERCSRMNRECLPAIPKPRKRRATDGFEPKHITLSDLIEQTSPKQDRFRPVTRPFITEITNPDPHPPSPLRTARSDISEQSNRSLISIFAQGLALDLRAADYLLQGVDHAYIRQCLSDFQHFAAQLPFITVPHLDPTTLVTQRPITTIAICVVASAARPDARSRFNDAFRHALAHRAIIDGEKNIDLMIGLFIYLCWNHQYFEKQQIYQYLFLLSGMAIDNGIQKSPSLADQARGVPDNETQKAFLGVYFICTMLTFTGFNKPAPLFWCPSLDHFASCLHSSGSREANLQPYIDLAHLIEDHTTLLNNTPTQSTALHVDLATKATLARLKALKRQHSSAATIPAYFAASVHLNARALSSEPTSGTSSAFLVQCAVAIKDYIDDLLARPPISMHHMAMVDWGNLIDVIVMVPRLSAPANLSMSRHPAATSWESSALASILQPEAVLDAICAHMASAPHGERYGPRHEVSLAWLTGMCDHIKRRLAQDRNGMNAGGDSHFDTVSKLDMARRGSHSSHPADDGRFRAVNLDTSAASPHRLRPPSAAWSPRGVPDVGFDSFGGAGLLDESFWTAFSRPAGR